MKTAGKNVVRDQVCNMNIAKSHAIKAAYQGKPYFFCSASCKARFSKNPAHYTKKVVKSLGKA
ncbi:MAG: YHS domain-containing protein [Armatimonadetes bacterium]|nr:YHS domain-containing protein [Armatimonadota bacterium]